MPLAAFTIEDAHSSGSGGPLDIRRGDDFRRQILRSNLSLLQSCRSAIRPRANILNHEWLWFYDEGPRQFIDVVELRERLRLAHPVQFAIRREGQYSSTCGLWH